MRKSFLKHVFLILVATSIVACSNQRQTIVQDPSPQPPPQIHESLKNQTLCWYVVRNKDHKLPRANTEGGFSLQKYDACYLGRDEKVIYLTFDEGYEKGYTSAILDTLKKHQVKAAFFVTEPYITSNPELINRMVREGHIVANHSKTHPSMPTKTGDGAAFRKELEDTSNAFSSLTGKDMPLFFRPPRGEFSEKSLSMTQQLGYKTIFWSFAYEDWLVDKQPSPDMALSKIISNTHNGEIMLLHAVSSTNAAILDQVLSQIKSQGYQFAALTVLP